MRPLLLLIGAVILAVWMIAPVAVAKGRFDGDWEVILSTKAGRCQRYYEFPVTIRDGAIRGIMSGQKGRYDIKGRISRDGSFAWGWGHSTGKLSDHEGTGRWETMAGVMGEGCSGAISLQRKH